MNSYFSKLNGYLCKDSEARELIDSINNSLINYYTKTEIDNALSNYYNKLEIDDKFTNYYTKTEIDNTLSSYYNKTEIDNTLSNYKLKSDYAVINGTLEIVDGVGSITRSYPSGFNGNNCVPIAMGLKIAGVYSFGYPYSSFVLNSKMNENNINITANSLTQMTGTLNYEYEVVLMKI